jgi:hypothetical protein
MNPKTRFSSISTFLTNKYSIYTFLKDTENYESIRCCFILLRENFWNIGVRRNFCTYILSINGEVRIKRIQVSKITIS